MSKEEGCCSTENSSTAPPNEGRETLFKLLLHHPAIVAASISLGLLLAGLALQHFLPQYFTGMFEAAWFAAAYMPVAWGVLRKAWHTIRRGEIFTEFFLMSVATLGAFAIGEYPEGVAVMLFYVVGEIFQDASVSQAKRSIKALLEVRPETVKTVRDGIVSEVKPEEVKQGEIIRLLAGEKLALDGTLVSATATFNTAALTGESAPQDKTVDDEVLAGMVNEGQTVEIRVTRQYQDTRLAEILKLVEQSAQRKAPTERFITRFAKIYTPVVVFLALLIVVVPAIGVEDYVFRDWLYRALVFLVISCPCALVVSIPLGYFGGIGAASRNGILFKGANYIDKMAGLTAVALDKTGTLTAGVFKVEKVVSVGLVNQEQFLALATGLETYSTHPVAKAIVKYAGDIVLPPYSAVTEIPGHGLLGIQDGQQVLAGNIRLMQKYAVPFPEEIRQLTSTAVLVAVDGRFAGYLAVADEIKPDAAQAIRELKQVGVKRIAVLSGDKNAVVKQVAESLGIVEARGELLPGDKVSILEQMIAPQETTAFVGDGINDAPVLARADIGIAMGGLGSAAAIESADVVIQTDAPSKIAVAVRIARSTRTVIWQNIGAAFAVKAAVMFLGAFGIATLWEAVFADVGVALLAILNASRIQRKRFS